ncbi:MAG: hypothetical protein LBC69_00005, partial [Eubacteriaceae bacterium]|nr:hypothetical protein [Eubacteriaceae bacterium]
IFALFPDAKIDIKESALLAGRSLAEVLSVAAEEKPARQLTSSLAENKKCAIHLDVYYYGSYVLYGAIPEEGNSQASTNYTIFMMCGDLWSAQFTIACNSSTNEISSVSGGSASPTKEGTGPGYQVSVTAAAKISNREAEMAIDETLRIVRADANFSCTIHYKLTAVTTSTSIDAVLRQV